MTEKLICDCCERELTNEEIKNKDFRVYGDSILCLKCYDEEIIW